MKAPKPDMASARDVGSWTTNLAPEKPGEPPPGWGGNKVSPLVETGEATPEKAGNADALTPP